MHACTVKLSQHPLDKNDFGDGWHVIHKTEIAGKKPLTEVSAGETWQQAIFHAYHQ